MKTMQAVSREDFLSGENIAAPDMFSLKLVMQNIVEFLLLPRNTAFNQHSFWGNEIHAVHYEFCNFIQTSKRYSIFIKTRLKWLLERLVDTLFFSPLRKNDYSSLATIFATYIRLHLLISNGNRNGEYTRWNAYYPYPWYASHSNVWCNVMTISVIYIMDFKAKFHFVYYYFSIDGWISCTKSMTVHELKLCICTVIRQI